MICVTPVSAAHHGAPFQHAAERAYWSGYPNNPFNYAGRDIAAEIAVERAAREYTAARARLEALRRQRVQQARQLQLHQQYIDELQRQEAAFAQSNFAFGRLPEGAHATSSTPRYTPGHLTSTQCFLEAVARVSREKRRLAHLARLNTAQDQSSQVGKGEKMTPAVRVPEVCHFSERRELPALTQYQAYPAAATNDARLMALLARLVNAVDDEGVQKVFNGPATRVSNLDEARPFVVAQPAAAIPQQPTQLQGPSQPVHRHEETVKPDHYQRYVPHVRSSGDMFMPESLKYSQAYPSASSEDIRLRALLARRLNGDNDTEVKQVIKDLISQIFGVTPSPAESETPATNASQDKGKARESPAIPFPWSHSQQHSEIKKTIHFEEPASDSPGADLHRAPAVSLSEAEAKEVYGRLGQRQLSMKTIDGLQVMLRELRGSFAFPSAVDSTPRPPAPSAESDSESEAYLLPFTRRNKPVLAYEHALNGLLSQLDSVESYGDEEVRKRRREVVLEVEQALGDVEKWVAGAYLAAEFATPAVRPRLDDLATEDAATSDTLTVDEPYDTSRLHPDPLTLDDAFVSSAAGQGVPSQDIDDPTNAVPTDSVAPREDVVAKDIDPQTIEAANTLEAEVGFAHSAETSEEELAAVDESLDEPTSDIAAPGEDLTVSSSAPFETTSSPAIEAPSVDIVNHAAVPTEPAIDDNANSEPFVPTDDGEHIEVEHADTALTSPSTEPKPFLLQSFNQEEDPKHVKAKVRASAGSDEDGDWEEAKAEDEESWSEVE